MNTTTNQKGGAPKELHWVSNLSDFDLGRPVTLLTMQPWPNRSNGPPVTFAPEISQCR